MDLIEEGLRLAGLPECTSSAALPLSSRPTSRPKPAAKSVESAEADEHLYLRAIARTGAVAVVTQHRSAGA